MKANSLKSRKSLRRKSKQNESESEDEEFEEFEDDGGGFVDLDNGGVGGNSLLENTIQLFTGSSGSSQGKSGKRMSHTNRIT